MKILLGQAYHLRDDPKNWDNMGAFPPLGSLYAAAVLREAGHTVTFHDSMIALGPDTWKTALDNAVPELALLYEDNFNFLTKMCLLDMRSAAEKMIAAAKAKNVPVVVAGSDPSDVPEIYLEMGANAVICGEGEQVLDQVVQAVKLNTSLDQIGGIAWRDSTGQVKRNPRLPNLKDLDSIPPAAWDLVDFDTYRELGHKRIGRFDLNLVTSRGCTFHCNWCAKPIWGRKYNCRSPESVAAEIAHISKVAAPDRIWFMDDIMGLKPGWMARFADSVEKTGVKIPFKCLSRADLLLRKNEIDALARAGCVEVWIGAESGSQKILDAMEKGTALQEIEDVTLKLKERGIQTHFFIQYGYPGETWQDIKETLALIWKLQPDGIGVSVSYPLPGTRFHSRVKEELGTKRNWQHSDDFAMLYEGTFDTTFYKILQRFTHRFQRVRSGLSKPLIRSETGNKIELKKSCRRAAGTVLCGIAATSMFIQLQTRRLTKKQNLQELKPKLNRTDAANPNASFD